MKTLVSGALPLLFCLSANLAHAQTAAKPPVIATATVPNDAQKTQQMVARILRETSILRQLPIKSQVKSGVKTRAEVEKMLTGKVQTELPSKQVLAGELLLRRLGLAPANFQLKSTYIAMMGEQIAGYYDSQTKVFVTTDRTDPMQLETVMAHELTHALQDQHFNLSRLEKWPSHDSDARLAMSALVEGDATLVMSRYMMQNPMRMLGVVASSFKAQGASPTFNAAPRVLREGLTFPYLKGLEFATNLYRDGGWKSVSAAFDNLPQSTEQILHYDKYLAREAPVKIALRDLSGKLGAGWTLLDHDVNGETGLFYTVAEHLGDDNAAKVAAAGWGGDRYSVYRGPKNADLVVQDTVWDSEFDARQWREAYARSTSKRFASFKPAQRGALQVWNAGKSGVWMEQRGRRVLILEGTVGAFNPAPLFTALGMGAGK